MSVVIDASVAIAWSLPDEASAFAESVLEQIRTDGAVTPVLFKFETANVLNVALKRGRIDAIVRDEILAHLHSLELTYDLDCLTRVWTTVPTLSQKHALSVYDGAYLDTALRHGFALATLDKRLASAAAAEDVELFEPKS